MNFPKRRRNSGEILNGKQHVKWRKVITSPCDDRMSDNRIYPAARGQCHKTTRKQRFFAVTHHRIGSIDRKMPQDASETNGESRVRMVACFHPL